VNFLCEQVKSKVKGVLLLLNIWHSLVTKLESLMQNHAYA
jgi:hypothetical protein